MRLQKSARVKRPLRKTAVLSHLYIKTIILPRQARDNIGTQKQMPFFAPVDAAGRPSDVKRVDEAPVGCAQ
jgi:hypothetical protein